ncbi:hypothetical protein CGCF413_v008303 [Colletotrichum fructicola]|nr:hypothetical protein CGCF413_v008303 [Colletotrichum fructicola]
MKEIIRGLYLVENRTLKDVIDVMKEKHGISATERMYKRRFKNWDWPKYNTKARRNPDKIIERFPGRARATCRRAHRRQLEFASSSSSRVPEPAVLRFFEICHVNRVAELNNILQGTAQQFGEFSDEALFVALWQLGAASLFSTSERIFELSNSIIIRLVSSNGGRHLSEWGLEDMQHYAWVNFNISKAYAERGQIEVSILPLKESIKATGYVLVNAEDEALIERADTQLVSKYGKLEQRLRIFGKVAEANKVNEYITKSTYLEEEEQNDLAENLDPILALPNSQER